MLEGQRTLQIRKGDHHQEMTMRISNRVSLLVLLLFLTVGSAYPTSRVVQQ